MVITEHSLELITATDDLAQFFDDSGEHAARLTSQMLLAEERGHRVAVEISDRHISLELIQPASMWLQWPGVQPRDEITQPARRIFECSQ